MFEILDSLPLALPLAAGFTGSFSWPKVRWKGSPLDNIFNWLEGAITPPTPKVPKFNEDSFEFPSLPSELGETSIRLGSKGSKRRKLNADRRGVSALKIPLS